LGPRSPAGVTADRPRSPARERGAWSPQPMTTTAKSHQPSPPTSHSQGNWNPRV